MVDDTGYRIFLVLHIFAVVITFAPGFVWPLVGRLASSNREGTTGATTGATTERGFRAPYAAIADNALKIQGIGAILMGLFGFAMIGMSDDLFEFSQTWVSIAMLLWFLTIGVIYGLLVPSLKKAADGSAEAEARMPMFYGMLHLLLLLAVIDMIWKPGF